MNKYKKIKHDSIFNRVDYRTLGVWTFLAASIADEDKEKQINSVIATYAYKSGKVIHCRTENHKAMCDKIPDIYFIGEGMWVRQ